MLEYLILGARGQLGREFLRVLGAKASGVSRADCDISDAAAVERILRTVHPHVVINTAAFNHVDAAERCRQEALASNLEGPALLARLSVLQGWRLVHYSTDYVFGGVAKKDAPYCESDTPSPVNFYGYSKLLGEEAVLRNASNALVLRVAHLYGGESLSPGRMSLVQRFQELLAAGQTLSITQGQVLTPTSVRDVVQATLRLLERNASGLFHLAGEGFCEAGQLVREIARQSGVEPKIEWVASDIRPARRARFTAIANRRLADLGITPLPPWRVSLRSYMTDMASNVPDRL